MSYAWAAPEVTHGTYPNQGLAVNTPTQMQFVKKENVTTGSSYRRRDLIYSVTGVVRRHICL